MNTNFGNKVTIEFQSPAGAPKLAILRNVTEIHFNYHNKNEKKMIAFESDIHGTGIIYAMDDVFNFETELESYKTEKF